MTIALERSVGGFFHEVVGEVLASRHPAHRQGDHVVGWASGFDGLMERVVADGRDLYAFRYSINDAANTLYYRASGKSVVIVSEPLDGDRSVWTPVPPDHMVVAKGDQPVACVPLPRDKRVAAE